MCGAESATATNAAASGFYLPGQGEAAIGVEFVRVGPPDMDEGRTPVAELDARRVAAGIGRLSCDQDPAESLNASPDDTVAFAAPHTRQDADASVASWERPVLGVEEFTAIGGAISEDHSASASAGAVSTTSTFGFFRSRKRTNAAPMSSKNEYATGTMSRVMRSESA